MPVVQPGSAGNTGLWGWRTIYTAVLVPLFCRGLSSQRRGANLCRGANSRSHVPASSIPLTTGGRHGRLERLASVGKLGVSLALGRLALGSIALGGLLVARVLQVDRVVDAPRAGVAPLSSQFTEALPGPARAALSR